MHLAPSATHRLQRILCTSVKRTHIHIHICIYTYDRYVRRRRWCVKWKRRSCMCSTNRTNAETHMSNVIEERHYCRKWQRTSKCPWYAGQEYMHTDIYTTHMYTHTSLCIFMGRYINMLRYRTMIVFSFTQQTTYMQVISYWSS